MVDVPVLVDMAKLLQLTDHQSIVVEAVEVDLTLAIAPVLVEMVVETDQHPIMEALLVQILVVEVVEVQVGQVIKMADLELLVL